MSSEASPPDHPLMRAIDRLAHLLPAQGPISIFIHHNTLHAFEHLPFEDAVEQAALQLDRQPYLAESRYRDKLASGRIRPKDVEVLLVEQLGARAADDIAGAASRLELWRAIVLHGIPAAVVGRTARRGRVRNLTALRYGWKDDRYVSRGRGPVRCTGDRSIAFPF